MKKFGFTLAEVLITLGIIGVISALTTPALIQNTASAQVGPKLAKAVSSFEVANQNMLTQIGADTLDAASVFEGDNESEGANYIENLSNYLKMTPYIEAAAGGEGEEAKNYASLLKNYNGESSSTGAPNGYDEYITGAVGNLGLSKDGFLYGVHKVDAGNDVTIPPYKRFNGFLLIDINGIAKPNKIGRDAFAFALYADGSIKPVGGNNWAPTEELSNSFNWLNGTSDKCNEDEVTSGWSCAGSILENNQKVVY